MRTWLTLSLRTTGLCLFSGTAVDASWQDLLDRADSLGAAGNLDSANIAVDEALSRALTEYERSDTIVGVISYNEGISDSLFFRSCVEAESLYTRALSIKERLDGNKHLEAARILMCLAQLSREQHKHSEDVLLYEQAPTASGLRMVS
jgi:hypothetical protein